MVLPSSVGERVAATHQTKPHEQSWGFCVCNHSPNKNRLLQQASILCQVLLQQPVCLMRREYQALILVVSYKAAVLAVLYQQPSRLKQTTEGVNGCPFFGLFGCFILGQQAVLQGRQVVRLNL